MIKIKDKKSFKVNNTANIKKYLNFNFSFITHDPDIINDDDVIKLFERMKFLSSEPYANMVFRYGKDKSKWFEKLSVDTISKDIPENFKEIFPSDTYSQYYVMRVYPSGKPKGSANPRIIGMMKDNTFYDFYLDWEGKLYDH